MYTTLGQAQEMTLTFNTHLYSFIKLDVCSYQLAGSVCCFLEQETFTPQKVLVIPRNRWLRLNMTEKLLTGTLNKNKKKNPLTADMPETV